MVPRIVHSSVGEAINAAGLSKERLCATIARHVAVQGFGVVEQVIEAAALLEGAAHDAASLAEEGHLEPPPAMIIEGLLGGHGSARVCDLWSGGEASEWLGGDNIWELDAKMTDLGEALVPHLFGAIGLELHSRTSGLVHEATMPQDEDPDLGGEVCARWLNTFAHHRLMLVWNLGRGQGTLELEPFDVQCNSIEVAMQPGTLVVLRPDLMLHRFASPNVAYCLTCFFLRDSAQRKNWDDTGDDQFTPCCQALEAWACGRMREFKESLPDDQSRLELPRSWELLASHANFVGQHLAVRSAGIRQPASFDPQGWASAFEVGMDYVTQVPLTRWDSSLIYVPDDGRGWKEWSTSCQHGAFIDGVELFDNSIFRLSRVESLGMDPGHRLTLETGYEALLQDGYTMKTLMNSRGGVYVANPPGSEWGDAEKTCGNLGICQGGSIACGRFSFIFGLKGPCISIDVEAASSLVAVHMAGTNLSRIGNWEPIPFAVCSSYNLQLSARPYVFGSCCGVLSPVGRTLALDGTADGFVRGDCAISLLLKTLADEVDDNHVVHDDNFLGALAGSATNQSGRRAHITAVDAVALQEVVADCLRQADISPLDVDACDLFADGMLMSDAIEASATTRAFRPHGMPHVDASAPAALLAAKTSLGNQLESCGLSSILKVVLAAQYGAMPPNIHSRILNPYIDFYLCARPALLPNELLGFVLESSYIGVANRSLSGTNCHVILWGHQVDPAGDVRGRETSSEGIGAADCSMMKAEHREEEKARRD